MSDHIEIVCSVGGSEWLRITSDGERNFVVTGSHLRHVANKKVTAYATEDDLHIQGLLNNQIGALLSQEVLRRALRDHENNE